jgi:hypothetical protein
MDVGFLTGVFDTLQDLVEGYDFALTVALSNIHFFDGHCVMGKLP